MRSIPLARPTFTGQEHLDVRDVIASGWVTQGPKVAEFERKFADYVGARHGVAVSSCTAALHLSLLVSGVKPGDVVITVSHSFIATANAIRHCGAEPVFVDIDPQTGNMDMAALEEFLLTECRARGDDIWYRDAQRLRTGHSPLCRAAEPLGRVAAILFVHQLGMPCDIGRGLVLAKKHDLPTIEDAACACGSERRSSAGHIWERIGLPHADLACFSFHPRKVITMGDGGIVTTASDRLAAKLRLLRQHSMAVSDRERHDSGSVIFESYPETGYNYRLTDIQAAVGIRQLEILPRLVEERRALAESYGRMLAELNWLSAPSVPEDARPNWQSYGVRFRDDSGVDQEEIMRVLLERGVATRRMVMNAHQEPAYAGQGWSLPRSEAARDGGIIIPLYVGMSADDQSYVVDALREAGPDSRS